MPANDRRRAGMPGSLTLIGCACALALVTACTTLTATQRNCFAGNAAFPAQASCIRQSVAGNPSLRDDPLVQEYVLTADKLSRGVKAGSVNEDDARLRLTQKLNDIRERDIAEQAQLSEIFSDRGPTVGGYTDCYRNPASAACLSY